MELKLPRYCSKSDHTIGYLLRTDLKSPEFLCATLEDGWHVAKIPGKTRIPAGRHEILLRNEGTLTGKYAAKFPGVHAGMLHLQDVPGFSYIYIHIGNDEDDTEGCILIGDTVYYQSRKLGDSTSAYRRIYPLIASELQSGNQVFITIEDIA